MNNDDVQLIKQWSDLKKRITDLTNAEKALRQAIRDRFAPGIYDETINFQIGPKHKLKMSQYATYNVDEEILQKEMNNLFSQGIDVNEIFRFKPSLNVKKYKELSSDDQLVLSDVITIKDGSFSVKIEVIK